MESQRKTSSKCFYYHQFDFFYVKNNSCTNRLPTKKIMHNRNARNQFHAPKNSEPEPPSCTSHDVNNNNLSRCPICFSQVGGIKEQLNRLAHDRALSNSRNVNPFKTVYFVTFPQKQCSGQRRTPFWKRQGCSSSRSRI